MDGEVNKINLDIQLLKEAIVKTVAYFDMFDFPLTGYEIWQYLSVKCELKEIMAVLKEVYQFNPLNPPLPSDADALAGRQGGQIESKNGFYYLSGREDIIRERMKRYNYSDKKLKLAIRLSIIFKLIPWIKLIAVGNVIGEHNLRHEGDIDLFVITAAKRIWLSRFFCNAITKILGLRPSPNKIRNKICLSFFISDDNLDLNYLRLSSGGEQKKDDSYFTYWLVGLMPIYNPDQTYQKFISANPWLVEQLPNWQVTGPSGRRNSGSSPSAFYQEIIDLLIGGLEPQAKSLQLKFLPANLKRIMNLDSRVVIDDRILKFHANDRREEYREIFKDKIERIINN